MKIKFTRHAKNKCRKFKYSDEIINDILDNPDDTSIDEKGNTVFWKTIKGKLTMVVAAIEESQTLIITIIQPRKRGKR